MAGFLPSEIPIRGDQSLPWFDPSWPWCLERLSRFALNSIFTKDPIDIDFSIVSAVAMWTGRREIQWEHCEPQQILVKHENTWLILMRHITEMELLRIFDNDIEQVNRIGQDGWPSQRYAVVGMQGGNSELVRASNRQNDKGEIECEVVVFNSQDEATQAKRVSKRIKSMIKEAGKTVWRYFNCDYSVAKAAEILASWGFVQSEHWPTIVSRFPEFAEASEYLIYLNLLYPDGSHPLHNRPVEVAHQAIESGSYKSKCEFDLSKGSVTWGEKRYMNIPKRAMRVLDLLYRRFDENAPEKSIVELHEIQALDVSVDGGMKSQVFKRHAVKEIVEQVKRGQYRLKKPY